MHKTYFKFIFLISTLILFIIHNPTYAINKNDYKAINKLIEEENVDEAFKNLKAITNKNKTLAANTQILIGKIYLSLEKPVKAYEYFKKSTFNSIKYSDEGYAGLALSSIKMGNLNDAHNYALKALKLNPDLVEGNIALGLIFSDYGQPEVAEKYFKQAVLKDSSNKTLHAIRIYAKSKLRRGKTLDAKKIINDALFDRKANASITDLLGKINWVEGNIDDAIELRTKASKMFKDAGNSFRSEQILSWLQSKNIIQSQNIKEIEVEQLLTKGIKNKVLIDISKTKVSKVKRRVLKPDSEPEKIIIDSNKKILTGSGFILNKGKWVVTNRHVIKNAKNVTVRNGLGKVRKVLEVKYPKNENLDLAILILTSPFPENVSLSSSEISRPKTGENIFIMGYPISSILGRYNPSISQGIISKNSGFGELPGEFQMTASLNVGNSGGPVFNENGQIVGVSLAKLDKKFILKQKGILIQDVNIAISGEVLLKFLNENLTDKPNKNEKYDASQIYKYMRPSVVFIVCQ